jgi:hypothetical protein
MAALVDGLSALGAPWLVTIICVPVVLPFIELIPLVILVLSLSCAAAFTTWVCGRLPNGERLSPGKLVTDLTVMRSIEAFRVVRAMDVQEPLRPTRARIIVARAAFAVTLVVAAGTLFVGGYAVYVGVSQTRTQASEEEMWQAREPEARAVCDAFIADMTTRAADSGSHYAVGAAEAALPAYREHLIASGTARLLESGSGQSEGHWEYTFMEAGDHAPDPVNSPTVNVTVEEQDGHFVVTELTWSPAPAPRAP